MHILLVNLWITQIKLPFYRYLPYEVILMTLQFDLLLCKTLQLINLSQN